MTIKEKSVQRSKEAIQDVYRLIADSIKHSLPLLKNNTIIFFPVFINISITVLTLPILFNLISDYGRISILSRNPLVNAPAIEMFSLILFLSLLTPFFTGGVYGMIYEAYEKGESSLTTFIISGKKYYFRILLASWLIGLVETVPVVVSSGLFVAPFLLGLDAPSLMDLRLLIEILSIPVIIILFLVQFYDICIVVEDQGIFKSYKKSAKVVWQNKLAVLTFILIILIPLWLILSLYVIPTETSISQLQYFARIPPVVIAVVGTILSGVSSALSVVFYNLLKIRSKRSMDNPQPEI